MLGSTRDTWDRAAASYDAERMEDAVYTAGLRAACSAIDQAHPARVLDVGCGTGLTTVPLCRSGRLVAAADYSHVSLRLLKEKSTTARLAQADVGALPYPDRYFDAVLCANMLQHLTPARHSVAIAELCRVLAPGGVLVVTVHHYSRSKQRAGWIKEGRPGQPGIDYIFRFSHDDLRRLLPAADIYAAGAWPSLERWLPRPALRVAALRGLGHMLTAIYRKPAP